MLQPCCLVYCDSSWIAWHWSAWPWSAWHWNAWHWSLMEISLYKLRTDKHKAELILTNTQGYLTAGARDIYACTYIYDICRHWQIRKYSLVNKSDNKSSMLTFRGETSGDGPRPISCAKRKVRRPQLKRTSIYLRSYMLRTFWNQFHLDFRNKYTWDIKVVVGQRQHLATLYVVSVIECFSAEKLIYLLRYYQISKIVFKTFQTYSNIKS